jgi:exosortase/archaeosortase family protein
LTAAVAYLCARPAWYRTVIVSSALPIALTANIARVVLTGYIMHFVNPQYAAGTFHTLEGLLMMGFGLLLLQSECWVLDRLCRVGQGPDPGTTAETWGTNIHSKEGSCRDFSVSCSAAQS